MRYNAQLNVTLLKGDVMKNKPMVMLLTMIAGWMNRQQQEIIEYINIFLPTCKEKTPHKIPKARPQK